MQKEIQEKAQKRDINAVRTKTKSELLAELMSDPVTYSKLDSAWRLAIKLLLSKNGRIQGTYADIATQLGGISPDSVKNWVRKLADQSVVSHQQKGWEITIALTDAYMSIATAPEVILNETPSAPQSSRESTALDKIIEGSNALGGNMTITINVSKMGGAQ